MPGPLTLAAVLDKPAVATEELTPFLADYLHADPAVPTVPAAVEGDILPPGVKGAFGGFAVGWIGGFNDPLWRTYKRVWGVKYDRCGEFVNGPPTLTVRGPRDYVYRPDPAKPFGFRRANGELITPPAMTTDGGSVPRLVWAIPGFDPWTYLWAYLIHDAQYTAHHCTPNYPYSFEDANQILGEGIYTMMVSGHVEPDWRVLVAIVAAVSSFVGRQVYGRAWTPAMCSACLDV